MLPDNIIDKKLESYINEKAFVRKGFVNKIIKEIIRFVSIQFTYGD